MDQTERAVDELRTLRILCQHLVTCVTIDASTRTVNLSSATEMVLGLIAEMVSRPSGREVGESA